MLETLYTVLFVIDSYIERFNMLATASSLQLTFQTHEINLLTTFTQMNDQGTVQI